MVKETDDFFSKEYIERNICHEMKDKMIERLSNTHISYDDIIENIRDIVLHSNHLSTSIEKDTDYPKQLLDNLAISVKGLNDVIDINNEEYTINESEILKDKNYEISCKSFINYLGSKVRLIIINSILKTHDLIDLYDDKIKNTKEKDKKLLIEEEKKQSINECIMNCKNKIINIVDNFKTLLKSKLLDNIVEEICNKFNLSNEVINDYSKDGIVNIIIQKLSIDFHYSRLLKIKDTYSKGE